MICVLETPIDLANFVELNNLLTNRKGESGGNPAVVTGATADFSGMAAGEKLYVLAHGSTTHVGKYDGPKFAKFLLERKLPAHTAKIVLVACDSGIGVIPLCQVIADELKKQSKNSVVVPVTGFSGNAVTDARGKSRAVDDVKSKLHEKDYDKILSAWDLKIKQWENMAGNLPVTTHDELVAGARTIAMASKPFFEDLYAINAKITKDRLGSKVRGVAV